MCNSFIYYIILSFCDPDSVTVILLHFVNTFTYYFFLYFITFLIQRSDNDCKKLVCARIDQGTYCGAWNSEGQCGSQGRKEQTSTEAGREHWNCA